MLRARCTRQGPQTPADRGCPPQSVITLTGTSPATYTRDESWSDHTPQPRAQRVTSVTSLGETVAHRTFAGGLDGSEGGSISSEGSDGLVPAAFDVRALGDQDVDMHENSKYMRVNVHEARPALNEGAAAHAEVPPAMAHVPIAKSVLDQIAFGSLHSSNGDAYDAGASLCTCSSSARTQVLSATRHPPGHVHVLCGSTSCARLQVKLELELE